MSKTAKILVSLGVLAFNVALIGYLFSQGLDVIYVVVAAIFVLASAQSLLSVWFGANWRTSPDYQAFLRRLGGRSD